MEIETLNAQVPLTNTRERMSFTSSSFTFDLPDLIENMKHCHTWAKGELDAIILLKQPEKQIMLTALHEGTEINSFQSNDSIAIQIIEGKLEYHTRKESVTLNKGQLLTLHENVKYSLITLEETVFLLTIANNTFQRSDN